MQGDAGHAQQGCVCVHVDRIHNTFLIINRFGVLAEKSSYIFVPALPHFQISSQKLLQKEDNSNNIFCHPNLNSARLQSFTGSQCLILFT